VVLFREFSRLEEIEATMNLEEIFHAALAKPPPERCEFLAAACAGDETLQMRVESLLHAHENPGSFLAERPSMPGATIDARISERPGTTIGPYKLLQQIGEGGMGLVWMAEQMQPVQRKVALKVIKPGMDSQQVVARFEAERQALAMMDHVNIARVFDGGTTPPSPLMKGGLGGVAVPTSSWSWSTACRSRNTATTTT
jgi:eukaryotic-like serine/threonine-protein kinase